MRSLLASVLMSAGLITATHAEVIISPPAFGGGPNQAIAVCYYSNLGTTAVTFNSSQIFVEPGNALPEASELCGGAEVAGGRCRTVANNIPNNLAIWCRADVSSRLNVRGRLEIRTNFGVVLTSEEAR